MVPEVRSWRDVQMAPGSATPAAAIGPVRQAPVVRRKSRIVWFLIGLRMAGNVLRSRQSYVLMTVGAIMLAALAHQARRHRPGDHPGRQRLCLTNRYPPFHGQLGRPHSGASPALRRARGPVFAQPFP